MVHYLVGEHNGDSVLMRYPPKYLSDPEELGRPLLVISRQFLKIAKIILVFKL